MSTLIKGLRIPPIGVRDCVIAFKDNYLLITDSCGNTIFEGEYVEIPSPHGRLIDADELEETIESIYGGALWTFDCFELINDEDEVPTVIEAEASE